MTKLYNEKIEVSHDQTGGPRSFIWRKKVYQVTGYTMEESQMDSFTFKRYLGPDHFKVETKQGLVCELLKDQDGQWTLERVWD